MSTENEALTKAHQHVTDWVAVARCTPADALYEAVHAANDAYTASRDDAWGGDERLREVFVDAQIDFEEVASSHNAGDATTATEGLEHLGIRVYANSHDVVVLVDNTVEVTIDAFLRHPEEVGEALARALHTILDAMGN